MLACLIAVIVVLLQQCACGYCVAELVVAMVVVVVMVVVMGEGGGGGRGRGFKPNECTSSTNTHSYGTQMNFLHLFQA
jgi:hypothetical protein